jgi:NTE family protein
MQKKISLVLSGGGARGIAHIGVIQVLKEQGYQIQSIAGTSMGALVGGLYASGGLEKFTDWLVNADVKEALKMLDFSLKLPGLIKAEKIMRQIDNFLTIKEIEELPIKYTAIATDIQSLSEIVFDSGSLSKAIRASIAIPSVFTPVFDEGKILIDGGLVNNLPINRLAKDETFPVVAVCVNAEVPMSKKYSEIMHQNKSKEHLAKLQKIKNHLAKYINRIDHKNKNHIGYAELIDKSIHLMIGRASQQIIQQNPPEKIINIPREICGTFDFLKAEKIIEIGRLACIDVLK